MSGRSDDLLALILYRRRRSARPTDRVRRAGAVHHQGRRRIVTRELCRRRLVGKLRTRTVVRVHQQFAVVKTEVEVRVSKTLAAFWTSLRHSPAVRALLPDLHFLKPDLYAISGIEAGHACRSGKGIFRGRHHRIVYIKFDGVTFVADLDHIFLGAVLDRG